MPFISCIRSIPNVCDSDCLVNNHILPYLHINRHICNHLISMLTYWGRVTHICVSKQTIIGSDNSLSPGQRQAIIWTNAGILLIRTLGTNFSEILIEIRIFSFKKMGLKVSSAKWQPFCLGLNVLNGMENNERSWHIGSAYFIYT